MTDQVKQFMLANLREEFLAFMHKMMKMPGSPQQKQQAFLRFDEGHMWMQNAVGSYVVPQPVENPLVIDEVDPVPGEEVQLPSIEELENQIQGDEGQVVTPEGLPVVSPAE